MATLGVSTDSELVALGTGDALEAAARVRDLLGMADPLRFQKRPTGAREITRAGQEVRDLVPDTSAIHRVGVASGGREVVPESSPDVSGGPPGTSTLLLGDGSGFPSSHGYRTSEDATERRYPVFMRERVTDGRHDRERSLRFLERGYPFVKTAGLVDTPTLPSDTGGMERELGVIGNQVPREQEQSIGRLKDPTSLEVSYPLEEGVGERALLG